MGSMVVASLHLFLSIGVECLIVLGLHLFSSIGMNILSHEAVRGCGDLAIDSDAFPTFHIRVGGSHG